MGDTYPVRAFPGRFVLVSYRVLSFRAFASYWLIILLWMGLIFGASGDSMSFVHTARIIGPIVRWFWPEVTGPQIWQIVLVVRKTAHVLEYAVLGLLVWRALRHFRDPESPSWDWLVALQAVLIVMVYATTDEIHQCFVPSRQGSQFDVFLDTSGAVLALFFLWIIGRWRRRW